jgi:hypothetical protein
VGSDKFEILRIFSTVSAMRKSTSECTARLVGVGQLESFFPVTTGGLWSTTRKRRVQEALELERAAQAELERQKKYSGPVGKDPWGNIAQDWTRYRFSHFRPK